MEKLINWTFDNGVFVFESPHDADLHCFEVFSGDRYLGTIYPNTIEDMNRCIEALDNGEDPISGGWEDGCGNVCSMAGWGDGVIYVEGETERNYNSFDDFCNNYWDCVECPYAYIVPDGSCEKHFNEIMRDELTEKIDWFEEITTRLRDYSEGNIWSSGAEILCKTEEVADALADMFECLYRAQGEEVLVNTGYYDPAEDERNGETDRYTGWWYVNIE